MDIIDEHFAAENAHDIPRTLATYADDIIWDDVSNPLCPVQGKAGAEANYEDIMRTIPDLRLESVLRFASDEHVVDEGILTGHVNGTYLGIECDGAPLRFRILHVFDVRNGLIAREQAWFDTAGVMAGLEAWVAERRAAD
jgi:steroid delta-isomerase-like uncharacterized protein